MKIATFNAEFGVGITKGWYELLWSQHKFWLPHSHEKLENFGREISNQEIDLVTLTEIEGSSFRSGYGPQIEEIRKSSNLRYSQFFKTRETPKIISQGNGVISRFSLNNPQTYKLPGGIDKRVLGKATFTLNKKEIDIYVTHLSLGKRASQKQLTEISRIVRKSKRPYIIAGDFNINEFSRLSNFIEDLDCLKFPNIHKTFPSWSPSRYLDRIFLSKDFKINNSYTIKYPKFSDHLPLVYDVSLR